MAVLSGAITFLNWVLPVIPFWLRSTFAVIFVLIVLDLCLRSESVIHSLPSPHSRLFLSIFLFALILLFLWNPLRTQYMQEHLEPSTPFIFGGPLGENYSPTWVMMIRHYGPGPAYNCDVSFSDFGRKRIEHNWLLQHPNSPFVPLQLVGESQKVFPRVPEVDPMGFFTTFQWTPLDPNHQHYGAGMICRDGDFVEDWQIARVDGVLLTKIKVERYFPFTDRKAETVFSCVDTSFPSADPIESQQVNEQGQAAQVNPGWKPNHVFTFPVVIFDSNYNMEELTIKQPGCWKYLLKHYGDSRLPLTFSEREWIGVAWVSVFLILPSYCLIAFWRMSVPLHWPPF